MASVFIITRSALRRWPQHVARRERFHVTASSCSSSSAANRIATIRTSTGTTEQRFSTEAKPAKSCYAVVDHAEAYREAMAGRHGKQLQLAYDEGHGKDEDVDYFAVFDELQKEEEVEEYDDDDDDDESTEDDDADDEKAKDDDVEEEEDDDDDDDDYEDDDDDDDDDDEFVPRRYNNDGSPIRPKSELIALRSGAPAGGAFAVVELGGFQHKVAPDDLVVCNKLRPVDKYHVGATLTLTDASVLLVADAHRTLVGLPSVRGAEVDVLIEEITHDKTVIVFKKRRRKHSRRRNGFRREVTFVRILDVRMPPDQRGTDAAAVESPATEEEETAATVTKKKTEIAE